MDLTPFRQDIDELIDEFTACESPTLSEFKRVWGSKKFSFLFEASPSTNQGFFMQSLYAHCISYIVSSANPLVNKLGGLYCLYCLYQTQPFKPPFKIYLSLEEMRRLKSLVIDSKEEGVVIVSALVKSMLERDAFLFGSVGATLEFSVSERVGELTEIQNAQLRVAYDKLFADTNLERFIHVDLGEELEVDSLKKRSEDYALAKQNVIREAGRLVSVEDIKHIADPAILIGDVVGKAASDWDVQRESFYKLIGCNPLQVEVPENHEGSESFDELSEKRKESCDDCDDVEQQGNEDSEMGGEEDGGFGRELEDILLLPQSGFDDEGNERYDDEEEEC